MSPLTRRQDYSMCYSNVTPKSALPPFNDPKADGILRSSDGVYFRVFQVFFSFPLSFVETFSGILQPSEATSAYAETMDGLPVIPVSEDSKTLDSLLRFCYPIKFGENPVLEDFHHVLSVLKAAKKYSIDTIEKTIYRALVDPKILEKDSLRCFAVLCNARMKNECIIVAKYTLREPLIPAPFEEVDMLTSADWLKLLIYHQQCGSIVQKLFICTMAAVVRINLEQRANASSYNIIS
ncbi:hypothetical protein ID866_8916 [Astraeus odoratus]|nr:hypothetical protein ID866_8916 [Astraeus odoratus]